MLGLRKRLVWLYTKKNELYFFWISQGCATTVNRHPVKDFQVFLFFPSICGKDGCTYYGCWPCRMSTAPHMRSLPWFLQVKERCCSDSGPSVFFLFEPQSPSSCLYKKFDHGSTLASINPSSQSEPIRSQIQQNTRRGNLQITAAAVHKLHSVGEQKRTWHALLAEVARWWSCSLSH